METQMFSARAIDFAKWCVFSFTIILGLTLALLMLTLGEKSADAFMATNAPQVSLSGWFHVIWKDNFSNSQMTTVEYVLIDDLGEWTKILLDENLAAPFGGPLNLNRKRIKVTGDFVTVQRETIQASSLQIESPERAGESVGEATSPAISGSQPWVTILCRFADATGVTPHDVSYFEGLMGTEYPGMDHYWREVSYNIIDLAGSAVVGWYNLPQPESYYVQGGFDNLDKLLEDCTTVADTDVFFPNFVGINLMFNTNFSECCAYGGSTSLTRDGQTKQYAVTWMPTAGPGCWPDLGPTCEHNANYEYQGNMAHEMGHGFGLPHSSGPYDQTYDSHWDVMSNTTRAFCCPPPPHHPDYGFVGVHVISYHKDRLGWIPSSRKFIPTSGSSQTITIERLARPTSIDYFIAQIPINGSSSHFYTIEARKSAGYDDALPPLPGEAVIIHEVDTTRFDRLAQVVDIDNDGDPNDEGAMWLTGETFSDPKNQIMVTIDSATASGFVVTIEYLPTLTQRNYLPTVLKNP